MLPVLNKALPEQCLLPYLSSVFTTRSRADNTEVYCLGRERPTVGMVNGRIGGTSEQQAPKEPPKKRLRPYAFLAAL